MAKPPIRRALIEFSNFCDNDCYYCGIRHSQKIPRYSMSEAQILATCATAHKSGYRTFVLQSGQSNVYPVSALCLLIKKLKTLFPDTAVTLSIGEKTFSEYLALRKAGADRYLLKIETPDPDHYKVLHPPVMSYFQRVECLQALKRAGFVLGTGFITGLPQEPADFFSKAISFLKTFSPKMVAVGPFVSARATPFASFPNGKVVDTLRLVRAARTLFPQAFIPATSALGSSREKAFACGADVVMDNFTPKPLRALYRLYDQN